jgi:2'-5' RNA ligase
MQRALPGPLIRWVAPQNVHLTLKFLGDVSPAYLEKLAKALKVEVVTHETFSMSVGGLGSFPNPRKAHIIWIGLDAPPALTALLHGVEAVAETLGYASENRPFSPHLTIGRVRQNASGKDLHRIRSALEETTISTLGTFLVNAVHIFKSDLQLDGAVYSHLYSLPMKSTTS